MSDREILQQLRDELWWPPTRLGGAGAGYHPYPNPEPGRYVTPEIEEARANYWRHGDININRWRQMIMKVEEEDVRISLGQLYDGQTTRAKVITRGTLLDLLLEKMNE